MTLLVALKGSDGLVLAADSRGTFGDPRSTTAQNDTQMKANVVGAKAAVLIAGSGEVGSLVIKEFRERSAGNGTRGVTDVMNDLRSHVRELYQEWFPSVAAVPPPALAASGQIAMRPDLAFVIGGYDGDRAQIYQLTSQTDFSPMLHEYGFAVAGIAQYALYLLNRLYQPDRNVSELAALAVYAITETASQDGKVGGPVNVITVTPDGGCEQLGADDVLGIQEKNEQRSASLRDSFYLGARDAD